MRIQFLSINSGHKFTHAHEAAQLHLDCLVCQTDQTDQVEKFTIQGWVNHVVVQKPSLNSKKFKTIKHQKH